MPRERIQHGTPAYETEEAADIGSPALDVEWTREPTGHVQVAIEMSREQWLRNAETLQADEQVTRRAIYTDSLSRHEINHLIKTLRRARDAAYGRDE